MWLSVLVKRNDLEDIFRVRASRHFCSLFGVFLEKHISTLDVAELGEYIRRAGEYFFSLSPSGESVRLFLGHIQNKFVREIRLDLERRASLLARETDPDAFWDLVTMKLEKGVASDETLYDLAARTQFINVLFEGIASSVPPALAEYEDRGRQLVGMFAQLCVRGTSDLALGRLAMLLDNVRRSSDLDSLTPGLKALSGRDLRYLRQRTTAAFRKSQPTHVAELDWLSARVPAGFRETSAGICVGEIKIAGLKLIRVGISRVVHFHQDEG